MAFKRRIFGGMTCHPERSEGSAPQGWRIRGIVGMMNHHTSPIAAMPKAKLAITLDSGLLDELDELVEARQFANRSQAIESAVAHSIQRLRRTRLAREAAKLDPSREIAMAEEGMTRDSAEWPEY